MMDSKETLIDFYEGVDGPTIIIKIQSLEWLQWFRDEVLQLENGKINTIDLFSQKIVTGDGIVGMEIVKGINYSLVRVKTKYKKVGYFVWTLDAENIEDIIDCCNNLINSDKAGHYYFHDGKPAIIEFSYKE